MVITGLRLVGLYVALQSLSLVGLNLNRLAEWNADSTKLQFAQNWVEASLLIFSAVFLFGLLPSLALVYCAESIARWLERENTSGGNGVSVEGLYSVGIRLLALYFLVSGVASVLFGGTQVASSLFDARGSLGLWFSLPKLVEGLVRASAGAWLYSRRDDYGTPKRDA